MFVMARTDDIINVGAVRLSTGAIEEVINRSCRSLSFSCHSLKALFFCILV